MQTLTASQKVIVVGDTFTVSGTVNYGGGTIKPVTAYLPYGFDSKILTAAHSYVPTFVARAAGTTEIFNDNSGVTGRVIVTVVSAGNRPLAKPTVVGQTITLNKKMLTVGDTFTVTGVLNYSDGTTQPVTAYRLYGFNAGVVTSPNGFTPTFVAQAAGTTDILNDNAGVTGRMNVTILPTRN